MNLDFPPNGRIEFFDFAHGHSTPIFALDKPFPFFSGLALSPDGKSASFRANRTHRVRHHGHEELSLALCLDDIPRM